MPSSYQTFLGSEMDVSDIDEFLTRTGVGVLSMSVDGVPYGVPLSFGYDGDALYFLFVGRSVNLKKERYAERSRQASFAAFDVDPDGSWRSAIVTGPITRITPQEWDSARAALADNAFESDLLGEHDIEEHPNVWALDIEERSGRIVGSGWSGLS
ncbi:MAG: pyridoxamine 5'-phosphate oxidase family protein [Haloplanus sp.]